MTANSAATATKPYRRAIPPHVIESRWTATDGTRIRRLCWKVPAGIPSRGSLLFLPGRGDFYEKYLETLAHWHLAGWNIASSDWRGQAGSGRLGDDQHTGHIDDFATWVADLAVLWRDFCATMPGPHVLVGHSMGGHLVLRALAEGVVDPQALVLSAPLLGMHGLGLPSAALHRIARGIVALGRPQRRAWRVSEKPGSPAERRIMLLTHDSGRYADEQWWLQQRPELMMGPASWGWVERALASICRLQTPGMLEHITTPVQIIATRADRLVSYAAIAREVARLPQGELVSFGREAAHELLREQDAIRDACLAAIDRFLGRVVPMARPERRMSGLGR